MGRYNTNFPSRDAIKAHLEDKNIHPRSLKRTKSIAFSPAYPNLVQDYVGTNITISMFADDSYGNYYDVVAAGGDGYARLRFNFTIPDDFITFSSNAIGLDIWTESATVTITDVHLAIVQTNPYTGAHTHVITISDLASAGAFTQQIITSAQLATGGVTWAAGDVLQLEIIPYADDGYYVDLGRIIIYYRI